MMLELQPAVLLVSCLIGVLVACRATVVGLALLSPVLFGALWSLTGSVWIALCGAIALQVGFFLPTLITALSRYFFPVPSTGDQQA